MADNGKKGVHGTRYSVEKNLPENLGKIFDALQRGTRKFGYFSGPSAVRGAIARADPGDKSRGEEDERLRLLENLGVLLYDEKTKRFYYDNMRAQYVRTAIGEGSPVLPAGDLGARLRTVHRTFMAKRRKAGKREGVILLPGPRQPTASNAGDAKNAELAPPVMVPAIAVDASLFAGEKTLHLLLAHLKRDHGFPDIDRLTTPFMKAVLGAVLPKYADASTAISHWHKGGLIRKVGYLRQRHVVWEVLPKNYMQSPRSGGTAVPLRPDDIDALLALHAAGLKQLVADVEESVIRWPIGNPLKKEERDDEEAEPMPAQPIIPPHTPPTYAPEPAPESEPVEAADIASIESAILALFAKRRLIRQEAKEKKQREAATARLRGEIELLSLRAEGLRQAEVEAEQEAERARVLFRQHKAEAERLAGEASAAEASLDAQQMKLRELMST